MYSEIISKFGTVEYRAELTRELQQTQSRHDVLVAKRARLLEQIEMLQKEGCQKLTDRLSEVCLLNMDHDTFRATSDIYPKLVSVEHCRPCPT
jgi:hypothetical protein